MHLHLTFFAGKSAVLPCWTPLKKRKHDFQYAIKKSMKIGFVFENFEQEVFNLVVQSRLRFHRKNGDSVTVVARGIAMFLKYQ